MRWVLIGLLMVMSLTAASAQEGPPKSFKTLKIQRSSLEATAFYAIDPDGTVKIDWDAVETLASSKADRTMSPVAEVMLAIRGGKWKPMR
jgi:hypothetical protein